MTSTAQAYEWVKTGHWGLRQFKEWFDLQAEAEREACAKVCEEGEFMTFGCAAEAIRARGQA